MVNPKNMGYNLITPLQNEGNRGFPIFLRLPFSSQKKTETCRKVGLLGCPAGNDRFTILSKLVYFTYLRDVFTTYLYRGYFPVTKYRQDIPVVGFSPPDAHQIGSSLPVSGVK